MNASAHQGGPLDEKRTWCLTCRALYRATYTRCPYDGGELKPADEDPLVGTVLAERYVIEAVIGEGGLGRVYRARHKRMSRRYALKVPYGELTHDARARARFLREADVVGRLEHPAVVAATDVGETETGLLYLAMDLAEGFGLDVVLQAGPMPGHRIPVLVEQLLSGLAHAHERGIVHRDLKPANVIVDRDTVRVVDFGIAALAEDSSGGHTRLTTEGTIIGTPHYMAPEQLSAAAVDARTDLFSLGVMLYEMLSGKLPFEGAPMEIAAQNGGSEIPRVAVRAPEAGPVDPLIEAVSRWLMEKDPANRPQTAGDALRVLRLVRDDRAAAAQALAPWMESERAAAVAQERDSRETTRISGRAATEALSAVSLTPAAAGSSRGFARRRVMILGVAMVPVMALGIWWTLSGAQKQPATGNAETQRETETETKTEKQRATGNAEPETPTQPADVANAGPVETAGSQPPTSPQPPVTRPTTKRPTGPRTTTAAPTAPAASTSSGFATRYSAVGESLAAFGRAHGDGAITDLTTRYRAIAYLEAVRKPDERDAAMKELDSIARALAKRK